MRFDAFRNYTEPESRYKSGDSVYLDFERGDSEGPYTVKSTYFNAITKIFMYSFEETNISVAECYLKSHPEDEKLCWSECMYDDSGIVEEMLSSGTKLHGGRGINGQLVVEFFQPDYEFVKWIAAYAKNRIIVDIGCGSGRVLEWLQQAGARAIGVDPFWDIEAGADMNMQRVTSGKEMIHVLPKRIEDLPEVYVGKGDRVLLLFCRPCHSQFVFHVLKHKDADTEVLYITIPENMERYNDLGTFHDKAKLIPHIGYSVENEKVYSIK